MVSINEMAESKIIEFTEKKNEKETLIDTCQKMIRMYQDKINMYNKTLEKEEKELTEFLFQLIPEGAYKETKTQYSYKFPSGTFIQKKSSKSIKLKEDCNMDNIPKEYIKIKKSVDWINYKKKLDIDGKHVINKETGEIIDNCTIETKPFECKIKISAIEELKRLLRKEKD